MPQDTFSGSKTFLRGNPRRRVFLAENSPAGSSPCEDFPGGKSSWQWECLPWKSKLTAPTCHILWQRDKSFPGGKLPCKVLASGNQLSLRIRYRLPNENARGDILRKENLQPGKSLKTTFPCREFPCRKLSLRRYPQRESSLALENAYLGVEIEQI
jgi:hypothetical protein